MSKKFEKGKMVPVPSHAIIPERDIDKSPILECSHLGIDFGGLRAVNDFNLTIGRTEIAGLIGPNGAGKTTIFNLLTKVYQPTRGTILLDGLDTSGKTTAQINRMGIARTFQNIRLFNNLSVEDNVKIGLHNQERYSAITGVLRLPWYWRRGKAAHERALELLSLFGMADLADHQAGSLPYGAQRRLEIVRALATNPSLLLLDEPAAGMNPSETAELMENIVKIRDTFQIAVMLIEHDMNLVMNICEGICVLNFGQVIAKGTAEERSNPTPPSLRHISANRRRRDRGTDSESQRHQRLLRRHPRHQGRLLRGKSRRGRHPDRRQRRRQIHHPADHLRPAPLPHRLHRISGENLMGVPAHKVVAKGLAQVPEGRRVFLQMTVEENLEMGAYTRSGGDIDADLEKVYAYFPG